MRRRLRWEKEEAEIKAGKVRPVLRAALREGKKAEAERKKAEEEEDAAVRAQCDANVKFSPDGPPDPESDP
jgi:hypothetical protein